MMNNSESESTSSDAPSSSSISISTSKSNDEATSKEQHFSKTIRDQFFTNISKNEKNWSATCLICNEIVLDNVGVTSNVNRHVKKKHQAEYTEWSNKLNELDRQQPKLFDFISKKRSSSPSKQSYPTGHHRQRQLHDAIVQELIIELGLPLSLVERPEFIKFMSIVDPKFKITSRRTLRRTTIPLLYNKMHDLLKEFCSRAEYISLTLDIWTNRRTRSFFSITGHAIIDTEFKSYVLCFLPLQGSHTSQNLFEHYDLIINEFQIKNKLCRIVTDNASNNIKAFEDLIIPGFESYFSDYDDDNDGNNNLSENHGNDSDMSDDDCYDSPATSNSIPMQDTLNIFKDSLDNLASKSELRIPCFAHTLQLVIKDGLEEAACIKQAISKVSKISKLAHSSTTFADKLETIGGSIPKPNKTRWNSQLHTVQKILEIQSTQLNSILTELKKKDLCLGPRDITMLNEFVSLLIFFEEATTITQAENSPSISLVAPSIVSIYYDLINEQHNIIYTTTLCKALLSSLISRFGGLLESLNIDFDIIVEKKSTYHLYGDPIFLVSAFLDGKFKLRWITESGLIEEKKTEICSKIKNLVFDYCVVSCNAVHDLNAAAMEEDIIEDTSTINTKRKNKHVDHALLACRIRQRYATGETPFHMIYGVEVKLPGDEQLPIINHLVQQRAIVHQRLDLNPNNNEIDDIDDGQDSDSDSEYDPIVTESDDISTNKHMSEESDSLNSDIDQSDIAADSQPETLQKAGVTWSIHSIPVQGRISTANIMKKKPDSITKILDEIGLHINHYAERHFDQMQRSYQGSNTMKLNSLQWKLLDRIELESFIGLLIQSGVNKNNHELLSGLWDISQATMSLERYRYLLQFIRFDDRQHRDKSDRLSPHILTFAYHPRSNGIIERFNHLFDSILAKYVGGETPFYMIHGVEMKSPGDEQVPIINHLVQ
ncbi:unnamed protein product [Rotaria sordida]|uniref:PiggyBac transposable element-derived protein domain-containing protein n=1 Tax=Rotaria sordida TaxID=392033 RepID=A0A815NPW4_9BILA|nr:unnamed protein product [Rotaria sordida]